MSYGVVVFDPLQMPPGRSLGDTWDEQRYQNASKVDADRSARKWQLRDALMAFNPRLVFHEPPPPPGAIAQFFSASVVPTRSLTLVMPAAQDEEMDFTIYDDAIEIELPFFATREDAQYYMTELWRHLAQLAKLGFSAIYDIERDAVLALDTDFDVALEQYMQNLSEDWEHTADATASPPTQVPAVAIEPGPAEVPASLRPQPSTASSAPPLARPAVPTPHRHHSPSHLPGTSPRPGRGGSSGNPMN